MRKKFKINKIYKDCDNLDYLPVYLQAVEINKKEDCIFFKQVGGPDRYCKDANGNIPFNIPNLELIEISDEEVSRLCSENIIHLKQHDDDLNVLK